MLISTALRDGSEKNQVAWDHSPGCKADILTLRLTNKVFCLARESFDLVGKPFCLAHECLCVVHESFCVVDEC